MEASHKSDVCGTPVVTSHKYVQHLGQPLHQAAVLLCVAFICCPASIWSMCRMQRHHDVRPDTLPSQGMDRDAAANGTSPLRLSCTRPHRVRLLQAVHATEAWAATGFESITPRVWDLPTQQATFTAAAPKGNRKLPPHDPHTTSLAFLVSLWDICDRCWSWGCAFAYNLQPAIGMEGTNDAACWQRLQVCMFRWRCGSLAQQNTPWHSILGPVM